MTWLAEEKGRSVLLLNEYPAAIAKAARYVPTTRRTETLQLLEAVRRYAARNVKLVARALEAGDAEAVETVERQEILDDTIKRLEGLIASRRGPISPRRARRRRGGHR